MRFEGGEVEGERGLQPRSEIRMRVGSKGSEGTCKFGNNCKFLHSTSNSNSGNVFNRFSDPNRFSYLNPDEKLKQKMKQKVGSVESSAEIVQNDFKNWLPSKVWPFSCYSVNGIEQLFPELKDLSVDEARYAFYNAHTSGSVNQHVNEIVMEGQKIQQFIDLVSKTSRTDIINLIRQKIGTDAENPITNNTSESQSPNVFGSPTNTNGSGVSNPFMGNSNSNSPFSSQPGFASNNSTVFGSSMSSGFGSNSNNAFALSNKPNQQAPNSNPSNIFQSSASMNQNTNNLNNPFLAASSSIAPKSDNVFGSSSTISQSSFGGNGGGFGFPSFGQSPLSQSNNPPPATGQSLFSQSSSSQQSIFGSSNTSFGQTGFGQISNQLSNQPQTNVKAPSNTPNPFSTTDSYAVPQSNQNNDFASNPSSSTPSNPFATSAQVTQPVVSNITEDLSRIPKLTEEDLLQYKNISFQWGKIPECPPPPELCC
ncbi:hypothetical protein ACHWQZ_G005235 [Mnemiopsis leidyi]